MHTVLISPERQGEELGSIAAASLCSALAVPAARVPTLVLLKSELACDAGQPSRLAAGCSACLQAHEGFDMADEICLCIICNLQGPC